ncbi:hypothetical protein E4U56_007941 [Claviceps arundinis]|uniref:Uncharacterized protein n=1 Tax=Claviceps arundinis TaxID=1623583 RepID=A0A9P7SKP2_9HYPO|nr:hypothetical protein E4U56_007941 [Claviceps arundinis]
MSSTVDEIYAREHQTEASPSLSHGLLNIWVSTQRSSNIDLWQPTPPGLSSLFQTVNRGHHALCWLWSKPPAISLDDTRIQRWIKLMRRHAMGWRSKKKEDNAANLTAQDFHD